MKVKVYIREKETPFGWKAWFKKLEVVKGGRNEQCSSKPGKIYCNYYSLGNSVLKQLT